MRKALLFVLCLLSLVHSFDPKKYQKSQQLQDKYTLYWTKDGEFMNIALEVETTGWVGFGLGESTSGSMPGADIVTATVINGVTKIYDRYALAKAYPDEDECNHWTLINGEEANGKTIIELRRAINTGDKQDRAFEDSNKVVIAWGNTDTFKEHDYKFAIQVNFWDANNSNHKTIPAGGAFWPFKCANYTIPTQKTTYADFFFNVSIGETDVHAIAFEPVFTESSRKFVHHFVLFGSEIVGNKGNSLDPSWSVLWAWAPGIAPFVFPDNVGMKFGPTGLKSIRLQIHYDNALIEPGVIDPASGVNIYYTSPLRQHDAGVFETGDIFVRNPSIIPKGTGLSSFEYSCPGDCSAKFPGPLHVFQVFLHMHQVGAQMWGTQWRNGSLVRETNRVDFFDFGFQQHTPVQFDILPGDRINTHCVYKQLPDATTKFGTGSEDEMCVQYILYYPKYNMQYCGFFANKTVDVTLGNYTYCNYTGILNQVNPDVKDPSGGEKILFGTSNGPNPCPLTSSAESNTEKETEEESASDRISPVVLLGSILLSLMLIVII